MPERSGPRHWGQSVEAGGACPASVAAPRTMATAKVHGVRRKLIGRSIRGPIRCRIRAFQVWGDHYEPCEACGCDGRVAGQRRGGPRAEWRLYAVERAEPGRV